MAKNKKKRIDQQGEISLASDEKLSLSIGALSGLSEAIPSKPKPSAQSSASESSGGDIASFLKSVQQVTLHRESSGRGGRIVTAVATKPAPDKHTAEALARTMKKDLGCGAHVENLRVLLQGSIQTRAEEWFLKQGVKKIVMGN